MTREEFIKDMSACTNPIMQSNIENSIRTVLDRYDKLFKEKKISVPSVTLNHIEYAIQHRLNLEGEGWEIINYTVNRPVEELAQTIEQLRRDYPQYEYRIVMRELSDWYLPGDK